MRRVMGSPTDGEQEPISSTTDSNSAGTHEVRRVAKLAGYTTIAQVITVASAPILTRLYSPADFGIFGVVAGVTLVLGTILGLSYSSAIPLPATDREAQSLVRLSLTIVTTLGLLSFLAWGGLLLLGVLPDTPVYVYLLISPVAAILFGLNSTFSMWAVRKKQLATIGRAKLDQSLASTAGQIGIGVAVSGPLGLVISTPAANGVGTSRLWRFFRSSREGPRSTMAEVRRVASQYRRFPMIVTPSSMLNVALGQAPQLLFAALISPAVAGYYVVANRLIGMPSLLVSGAVSSGFYSDAANAHREGKLAARLSAYTGTLVRVGLPIFGVVAVSAETFVPFLLGAQWVVAGSLVAVLSPWFFLRFVVSPISTAIWVVNREGLAIVFQVLNFAAMLLSLLYASMNDWDVVATVTFFSALGCGATGTYYAVLMRVSGVGLWQWLRPLLIEVLVVGPVLLALYFTNAAINAWTTHEVIQALCVAVVSGFVLLGLLAWRAGAVLKRLRPSKRKGFDVQP